MLEQIPTYAAVLGAALLVIQNLFMLNVGMYRAGIKKGVGVDGDIKLERLVRRHGNLAENAAIFIAVLALYEWTLGQNSFAFWIAIVFFSARVMHALGFSSDAGSHLKDARGGRLFFLAMRSGGATLTALSSLLLGGALLYSMLI